MPTPLIRVYRWIVRRIGWHLVTFKHWVERLMLYTHHHYTVYNVSRGSIQVVQQERQQSYIVLWKFSNGLEPIVAALRVSSSIFPL